MELKRRNEEYLSSSEIRQEFGERADRLVQRFRGHTIAAGILLSVLGLMALFAPMATSVGVAVALGVILLVAGVVQLVHAWQGRHLKTGRWSRPILALLSLAAGAIILRSPFGGVIAITLMITFYLFATAGAQFAMALETKPLKGWGWLVASSIVSFVLGVYLFATFPTTSLVIPGIFFGVDLLFYGSSLIGLGIAVGRIGRAEHEREHIEKKAA